MSSTTQVRIYRQTFSGIGITLTMYGGSGTTPEYSPAEWAQASGLTMSYPWSYINTIVPSGNVPSGYTHKWKFVQWIQSGANEPMRATDMMTWAGNSLAINSIIALDRAINYPTINNKQTYYYFDIVEITAKTYIATFVYDNGDINTTANYIFNTSFTLATPKKTGFTFDGWASDPYTGEIGTDFTWTVVNNITFIAQWTEIIYTINYDRNSPANSGTGSTAQTSALYNADTIYINPNGFTRTGYIFMGWGTDINNVNSNYIPGTNITNPKTNTTITLYAIWGFNITYSSTINSITTTTIVLKIAGLIIGTFPNYLLTLNNQFPYIFKGWGYTSVDTVLITSFSLVSNITLFAIWDTNNGVSFTSIQKVFGGNYPIYLSEYYLNKGLVYSPGGIGIPKSGLPIKLSQIIGKYNSPWMPTRIVSGNTSANMDEDNAIPMFNGLSSNNDSSIINVGFQFFWFEIDYGTNSNIKWNANNGLIFGSTDNLNSWVSSLAANTGKGVYIGYYDRVLYSAIEFNSYRISGFNVKRFIVKSSDYQEIPPNPLIIMEIILIRNSTKQFIEIKLNKWSSAMQKGEWKISSGSLFYEILSGFSTRLQNGASILLNSSLNGTGWGATNESLVLASLAIDTLINSTNLLLYLDGYNINDLLNFGLNSSSTIANWVNLANTSLTATQVTIASQPLYASPGATPESPNGVAFTNNKALVSNINLHNYPQINIFIVLKKTSITNNLVKWIWTVSSEGSAPSTGTGFFQTEAKYGIGLYYIDNTSANGFSYFVLNIGDSFIYRFIYKLPYNSVVVLNCEYNSAGSFGKFSINGESVDFDSTPRIINQAIKLYIGANTINGNTNSFTGNIYEFVVINGLLTDTERRNIYNLLYTKWNIVVFDDIRGMGKNLILRHDAKDVDGDLNFVTSSKISKWYNSANTTLLITTEMSSSLIVTTQTIELKKPAYTSNSVVFTSGTGLDSTMNINSYPKLNIFVVWKQQEFPTGFGFQQLWGNNDGFLFRAIIIYPGRIIRVYIGHPDINDNTQTVYGRLNNPFITNTNLIYNVEYNLPEQPGYVFINNTKYMEFPSMYSNRSSSTSFGYSSFYSLANSIDASIIGNIYEIIVINKLLSDAERTNIYKLLKTKWGIIDDEPITSMGANLVLRHTARNIDGSNNSTFTSTTVYPISSWYNSANTAFTTIQTVTLRQPSYTISYSDTIINYGVTFSTVTSPSTSGIGLLSTISIDTYAILNLFVVCKHAVFPTGTSIHLIWGGSSTNSRNLSLYNTNRIRLTYGSSFLDVTHTLSTNNIVIYNVEYNLLNQPGKFFINNVNVSTFNSLSVIQTTSAYFGSAYPGGGSRSMVGNIYEIILIDKILSDIERTNIYNSLRSSWGS